MSFQPLKRTFSYLYNYVPDFCKRQKENLTEHLFDPTNKIGDSDSIAIGLTKKHLNKNINNIKKKL